MPLADMFATGRPALMVLTDEERGALRGIAGPSLGLKSGKDLIREGDANNQLYLVTAGWACRYKTARDGSRQIVALLVPGDFANLDALMLGRPDYGVRALSPASVRALPCDRLLGLADEHRGIGRTLTRLALMENAILSQQAFCLGRRSAQQKLAHLICELAVRIDGDSLGSACFDLPLTQEQLADALGLTSVHVNRMMQQLRLLGLLVTANRTMTLLDVAGLRSVAGFDPAYLHMGIAAGPDRPM